LQHTILSNFLATSARTDRDAPAHLASRKRRIVERAKKYTLQLECSDAPGPVAELGHARHRRPFSAHTGGTGFPGQGAGSRQAQLKDDLAAL